MRYRALTFSIWESLTPGLRLPDQVKLTSFEKEYVKLIDWTDLDWEDFGNDGNTIVWLNCIEPFNNNINNGIVVDIQLVNDTFYQIHINLAESLSGLGLGTKIYRSLIEWAGHLYSGIGRRRNPIINKVWDNLKSESGVTCERNQLGDICISDNNPNRDQLLDLFRLL